MDYVHLFESGEYNPEEIKSEASREFIKGVEYAEESIDNFFGDGDVNDDFSPTLELIKKEIIFLSFIIISPSINYITQ